MTVFVVGSDQWHGEIPTYLPKFCDGWQPPAFWLEEIGVPATASAVPHPPAARYWKNGTQDTVYCIYASFVGHLAKLS